MPVEVGATTDPYARIAIAALRVLFGASYARDFGILLWDGTAVPAVGEERFLLRVNSPGTLRAAFTPPFDLNAGRAFAAGSIEIDGNAEHAVDVLLAASRDLRPLRALHLLRILRRLPSSKPPTLHEAQPRGRLHSLARDRAAVRFHYDRPVEFFRTFLDAQAVYSCAYYDDGIEALDDAQGAKLDYVLRKIRLRPGERLLDIGCGWGSLVVLAAERYGARAVGITLSTRQYDEAQRRIAASPARDRARVELRDYRELGGERFDKIVSIGMFEHVGRSRFREYFRIAHDALKPGGLFLNHAIANQSGSADGRASGFMANFVFPDGELVPVGHALAVAQSVGFEVRDVENLREHYLRTLRAWGANLERNRAQAVAAGGWESYRVWRLYMAGSAQGFRSGRLGLFQSLLARPRDDGTVDLPMTRRWLYL
jgi:cyclopropane-fatty-acyl-phospholipid synthase